MNLFSKFKSEFDEKYVSKSDFECFLPVHLNHNKKVRIKGLADKPNEEYYKWQFLSGIVNSGMYTKDFIGTEIRLPKGNKNSAPIKFDGAIFDDQDWFEHYSKWHKTGDQKELDWLRNHLIGVIEFKQDENKNIESVYNQQLKPALKESERDFCLGVLYDTERLYLFRKHKNKYLRLSEEFNQKGEDSGTKDLTLHIPDPYINIPTFDELIEWEHPKNKDRSTRGIENLDIISGIHSTQINDAMSAILRTMDKHSLVKQKGYDMFGGNIYAESEELRTETSKAYRPVTAGFFAQDQIAYKGIIITPGLRFDYFAPNAKYRVNRQGRFDFIRRSEDSLLAEASTKLQLSPRLFIAYPVTDLSVLNISYGVYYQMPQLSYMYDGFNTEILRPGASILGHPDMGPQKTNAYSIGYDVQLNQEFAVNLSAYYKDMYNIVGTAYTPAVPDPYYSYFTSEYGNSRGIELTLRKRMNNHFAFNVNYTLGFARGTSSGPASNFSVGVDPNSNKPLVPLTEHFLSFDRRHRLNAIVDFVWGNEEGPSIGGIYLIENTSLNLSGVFQSGLPFTQRDKNGNQVGNFNEQRQPNFWNVDMRLQRSFPLRDWFGDSFGNTSLNIFADVINLLNRTEPTALYTRSLDPDYDLATLNPQRSRGDITTEVTFYKADANNSASFNQNQFDNTYGERFYNETADLDRDGMVSPDEQYQGYFNFLNDFLARKVNYQYPRQVAIGIMLNF